MMNHFYNGSHAIDWSVHFFKFSVLPFVSQPWKLPTAKMDLLCVRGDTMIGKKPYIVEWNTNRNMHLGMSVVWIVKLAFSIYECSQEVFSDFFLLPNRLPKSVSYFPIHVCRFHITRTLSPSVRLNFLRLFTHLSILSLLVYIRSWSSTEIPTLRDEARPWRELGWMHERIRWFEKIFTERQTLIRLSTCRWLTVCHSRFYSNRKKVALQVISTSALKIRIPS